MDFNHTVNIFYPAVLSLVAGAPLLAVISCCLSACQRLRWNFLPLATVPALLSALFIPGKVIVYIPWFFMGGLMGIDEIGRIFLCITAVIWLLASFTVKENFQEREGEKRFCGYFLAAMGGNFGLILARDMLGFYLFFAIMSFAAYGLIVHDRTPEARRAGRIYLILVMVSEVAMFTALALIFSKTHSQSLVNIDIVSLSLPTLILLFIAFGVKVGALPFQSWMPPAYQQTPIPGATALAGAMVNAGILGWLRFIPLGYMVSESGALLFITAGSLAAIYGVVYGLGQNKVGQVLACSSMSQMGLMTVIVGLGLCSPEAGNYALFLLPLFVVHHSLAKGSLFLGYDRLEKGMRAGNLLLLVALLLPSLSLAGLPFTSGAVVKTALKEMAAISGINWYDMAKVFLPLSSLGTTILMLHCSHLLWLKAGRVERNINFWPWFAALTGSAFWFLFWPATDKLRSHSLDPSLLVSSFWPVAAGVLIAFLLFILVKNINWRPAHYFPDIDFGEKVGSFLAVLSTKFVYFVESISPSSKKVVKKLSLSPGSSLGILLRKPEKILGRWSMVGFFYLVVCLTLLSMLIYF